jgi:hypothetical protein
MFVLLDGLEIFKGFLKSEFSEENVEFWIACEEFRYSVDESISVEAQKIYGALHMVIISSTQFQNGIIFTRLVFIS